MPWSKSTISFTSLSNDTFTSNLGKLGVSLGSCSNEINLSIKTLKHIEVDRLKVTPSSKKTKIKTNNDLSIEMNPFDWSEVEDTEPDGALLAHLVKEVSEVDWDDAELGTKICDLMATARKSKSSSRKKRS